MVKPKILGIHIAILFFTLNCCMHPTQTFALMPVNQSEESLDFFVGTWNQACEIAEARQKPLFVYVYVNYERESNQMNNEVFTQSKIASFYEQNFINLKVNLHSQQGAFLRQKYQLRDFPSLLFFDQKRKLIVQDSGLKSVNEFLRIGKYALKSNQYKPVSGIISSIYTDFIEKKMQYENGVRHSEFLYNLAYDLKKFNDSFQPIVKEYIEKEGVDNLTKRRHLNFIFDFADDINDQPFEILLSYKERYIEVFGKETVDNRIKKSIRSAVIIAARYQNWEAFESIQYTIDKAQLSNQRDFEFLMLTVYHENTQNWDEFTNIVETYTRQNPYIEASILNDLAWRYALHIENKVKLQEALTWSEKAMEKEPKVFKYRETYATLLYIIGKKSKALKEAENAMVIARKYGGDYTTTIKLSQAIRSNQTPPKDLN